MSPEIKKRSEIPQTTIGGIIQNYLESPEFSQHAKIQNTYDAYKIDFIRFAEFCQTTGISSLDSVGRGDISSWFETMVTNGISTATILRRKSSMIGFLNWAEENGLINKSLAESLPPVHRENAIAYRSRSALNQTKLTALIKAAEEQPSLRDAVYIQIAVQTGALLEELIDLDRRDVRIQKNGQIGIRFYNRDKDKYNVEPVDDEAKNVILGYLSNENIDPDNPLFLGWRNNERITHQGVWFFLKKYRSIIDVPNLSPTMLRNTYYANRARQRRKTVSQ